MEKRNIYCDSAATTYVSAEVLTEMLPAFTTVYGNAASAHSFGLAANALVETARDRVAKAIKAGSPREIIFTSGGTEANNLAIIGLAEANKNNGNHVIVSAIEHHSVLDSAKRLEEMGYEVSYLPVNKLGLVNLAELLHEIKPTTILVSVIMANNEVGTIQNIKAISNICRDEKIVFHTDAVQAIGAVSIDVKQMGIDAMSMSSHKIYGPKGVGALYVKAGVALKKQILGGGQERNLRGGTQNVPGIVGFGKAIEVAVRDLNVNNQKIKYLRDYFIKEVMSKTEGVHLNGHPVQRLSSNINLSFEAVEGESILLMLSMAGIAVSTGSACNSASLEKSHVLKAMGVEDELAQSSIRFSFPKGITKEDIDYVVAELDKAIKKLRSYSPLRIKSKKGEK